MKSNPSPSAPLNLCPPTGVTGTTLPATCSDCGHPLTAGYHMPGEPCPTSPVKDTPAGFVGVLIAPDGTRHFSCYDTPGMTLERTGAMEFTSREAAEKACLFRLGKGDAFWNSERSARQSMAKEMMGWTYVVEPSSAPASPVDSVGVPAPDSAPLMDGRENLQGVTFVSKNHAGKTPWTVEHYHRNGEWVCRESQYGTTMNFHEREIKAWRKAPPVDGFKLQSMRLREERSRIIVMEDGSMLVANTEDEAEAIVEACASHAAKDAKIREADEILKRCAMWLGKMIADGGHMQCVAPNDCVRTLERVEAFRAALALPCA